MLPTLSPPTRSPAPARSRPSPTGELLTFTQTRRAPRIRPATDWLLAYAHDMSTHQILSHLAPYRGALPHPRHTGALTIALGHAAADRVLAR